MVYNAYFTELNLHICDNTQKRRICCKNYKYALNENFDGHSCPWRKAAKFCHPGLNLNLVAFRDFQNNQVSETFLGGMFGCPWELPHNIFGKWRQISNGGKSECQGCKLAGNQIEQFVLERSARLNLDPGRCDKCDGWSFARGRPLWMIICKRLVPQDDHLQEAGHSWWSFAEPSPSEFARCGPLHMMICKRLVPPDDHLQEAGPSRWSFAKGWPLRMINNNNNCGDGTEGGKEGKGEGGEDGGKKGREEEGKLLRTNERTDGTGLKAL